MRITGYMDTHSKRSVHRTDTIERLLDIRIHITKDLSMVGIIRDYWIYGHLTKGLSIGLLDTLTYIFGGKRIDSRLFMYNNE